MLKKGLKKNKAMKRGNRKYFIFFLNSLKNKKKEIKRYFGIKSI